MACIVRCMWPKVECRPHGQAKSLPVEGGSGGCGGVVLRCPVPPGIIIIFNVLAVVVVVVVVWSAVVRAVSGPSRELLFLPSRWCGGGGEVWHVVA